MKPVSNTRLLFTGMVQKPDGAIDLAKTALYIAKEEYPQLDVDYYLQILDSLSREIANETSDLSDSQQILFQINRVLFEKHGFHGNAENYYDPKNSFLNEVLDCKTGIPITLSLIYLEIAKRLGLKLEGIGFPGHFLLKYSSGESALYIDPFNRGKLLTEEDCNQKIVDMYQGQLVFQKDFLKPITNKQFLTRILNNLKGIYMNENNNAKALEVIERILLINPDLPQEIRDRGMLHLSSGNNSLALKDLRHYIKSIPFAPDKEEIQRYIQTIMGRIAALN
jgi:regulator of sirC expression with transglutaminase-like and TPR domain